MTTHRMAADRDGDNVPSDRVRAYAEVLHANWCRALDQGCPGPGAFSDCVTEAHRVMAVADQEQAELRATIARVEALHKREGLRWGRCTADGHAWPCPTVATLRGGETTDD